MGLPERIKQVRKHADLTQEKFAEAINLKQNTIATYEMGKVAPSDRTLSDICDKFGVNEAWLRNGDGEPFKPVPRDAEISAFVGKALANESKPFQKQLLHVLSRLSGEQWELLADIAEKLLEEQKKD